MRTPLNSKPGPIIVGEREGKFFEYKYCSTHICIEQDIGIFLDTMFKANLEKVAEVPAVRTGI